MAKKIFDIEGPKTYRVVMVYIVIDGIYGTAYFDDFELIESKELPLSLLVSSSHLCDGKSIEKHWCVSASVCDTTTVHFML